MPIRINLLAEQQAAEEMRRRDPIKRVIFAGAGLVVVMLLWIGITELNVSGARRELLSYEQRLKSLDEQSKLIKSNVAVMNDIDTRLKALDKYSRNRFLWGTFLDALQQSSIENVRLVEVRADQQYFAGDVNRFATTNLVLALSPKPAFWKFWARGEKQKPLNELVASALSTVTNKLPFTTNHMAYTFKTTPVSTNLTENKLTAKLEFSNPAWASEQITVEIKGRDYGAQAGMAIDEFARRIGNSDYYKNFLASEGFRFTERPPQARTDPADLLNPTAAFVPFTIQLESKERVFANE